MMSISDNIVTEQGVLLASDAEWENARFRTEVIAPLAQLKVVSCNLADNAAEKLSISRRQVYTLIKRYQHGEVKVVCPKK